LAFAILLNSALGDDLTDFFRIKNTYIDKYATDSMYNDSITSKQFMKGSFSIRQNNFNLLVSYLNYLITQGFKFN